MSIPMQHKLLDNLDSCFMFHIYIFFNFCLFLFHLFPPLFHCSKRDSGLRLVHFCFSWLRQWCGSNIFPNIHLPAGRFSSGRFSTVHMNYLKWKKWLMGIITFQSLQTITNGWLESVKISTVLIQKRSSYNCSQNDANYYNIRHTANKKQRWRKRCWTA